MALGSRSCPGAMADSGDLRFGRVGRRGFYAVARSMGVMDPRTREYLSGRFGDYYRRVSPALPPVGERREWGYIPWSRGETVMVRHQSLVDLGGLGEFLRRERPRHVYFSAGHYRSPGADSMAEKGWTGSDLIFDLDADHLPSVNPQEDTYAEMLAACKEELQRLLGFLRGDFGFSEVTVVFSGSRGYHVHVRDPGVQSLDRDARREIVEYLRGTGIELDDLVTTESVAGLGRSTPTEKRTLDPSGGWRRRVYDQLIALVDEVNSLEDDAALARLQEYDGIGPGRARKALSAIRTNHDEITRGNVDVHTDFVRLAGRVCEATITAESVVIDEPVTVDTHRLIRLPGSLHGGTGLAVTPVPLAELDGFDPLTDAVPEVFVGHEVTVDARGGPPVELGGEMFTVTAGEISVPEYVAVFLMAQGRAEKTPES